MNGFVQVMDNVKLTENGALAYESTADGVLDLFALGGAYRSRSNEDTKSLVEGALKHDREDLTLKCLFYLRDIRGGAGERRFFRVALRDYIKSRDLSYESIIEILKLVPEYGRWDDLIWIGVNSRDYTIKNICFEIISDQLIKDMKSDTPSLLAKWMPSENCSSKETKREATLLRNYLKLSPKRYRLILSELRKKIRIVERLMSSGLWFQIEYDKVPSQAMNKYSKAFCKRDEDRFREYIESVREGRGKINTSTLYPYQILEKHFVQNLKFTEADEALWSNLPNYINDKNKNALVVCDTSGSMYTVRPSAISVSVSLALYFAERNNGIFHNRFITFSERPHWHMVQGDTLNEKVENIEKSSWGFNTDINKVFRLILNIAVEHNIPQEDMPNLIYIITDMEFDEASDGKFKSTNYKAIRRDYKDAGYKVPQIVFWNVNARNNTVPVLNSQIGTTLVSGLSPSIFSFAVENKDPEEFMESVLLSDRYKNISSRIEASSETKEICKRLKLTR